MVNNAKTPEARSVARQADIAQEARVGALASSRTTALNRVEMIVNASCDLFNLL